MANIITTFGETYSIFDPSDGNFSIGPSVTLDINCPVQADPYLYRLTDFPTYQHAESLHLVLLGHFTFSQQWKDPYQVVPISKIKSVDINVVPWYDTILEEWTIKSTVTKKPTWSGVFPKEIALRVQLYAPQIALNA